MPIRAGVAAVLALLTLSCTSTSIGTTAPSTVKCQVSVENSLSTNIPSAGAAGTLELTTNRDCTWSVSSNAAWTQLGGETSGQGSATVSYKVLANPDAIVRRATIEVNNTQVALTQDGAPCRFTVAPANAAVPAGGGSITVNVDTLNGCAWSAVSDSAWLTMGGTATGTASGVFTLRAAANPGTERVGTIRVAGQSVVVTEAGTVVPEPPVPGQPAPTPAPVPTPIPPPPPSCAFTLASTSSRVVFGASTGSVSVSAAAGCAWTATSNASWITVTSGASGIGNGAVAFSIGANPGSERTGTLTIGGQTFTITQAALPCTFTVTASTQNFGSSGGNATLRVDAAHAGCAWTASSNVPWITLNTTSGSADMTVGFTVAANSGADRSGILTVAGRTLTITQSATPPPPCTFTIAPPNASLGADAGNATVTVTASAASCNWSAASNAPWLTIANGSSGTGNGTVTVAAAANPDPSPRSGTVTIAGQTFTVNQAAAPTCNFSIAPSSATVGPDAATTTISVTANCSWTATSNAPWLTIASGGSGAGSGSVVVSIAANTDPAPRGGTVTIAGQTFTVNQAAAAPCSFTIAPQGTNIGPDAGSATVTVTASAPTCTWTSVSNAAWITIVSGGGGTGSGSVALSFAANSADARTGTATIAGQTFTVTQAAAPPPCTFSIAPEAQTFDPAGGTVTVTVTASQPTCVWTATSQLPWVTFTGPASGTGSGTVQVTVAPNAGDARGGAVTIAGRSFGVFQGRAQ